MAGENLKFKVSYLIGIIGVLVSLLIAAITGYTNYIIGNIQESLTFNTTCIKEIKTELASNSNKIEKHLSWHDGKKEKSRDK
jgi:hypothetical protein